jgi:hypothetical protein
VGVVVQQRIFTVRGHNRIMNDLHRGTMETIRDDFLPFHFMTVAYQRYPGIFQPRTKRYQIMKAKVVRHQRPNEFTGALRRSVLMESKITATANRGAFQAKAPLETKILSGPRAGQIIRRPLTEQRRRELEFVSEQEIRLLSDRQAAQYVAAAYDPANQDIVLKQFR